MSFEFMTLLTFSPRGKSKNAELSKNLAGACKNGDVMLAEKIADKIKELNEENYFNDSVLIPVPRSTPLVLGAVFPAKILAEQLVKKGLGNYVYCGLKRSRPITKSSNNFSAESRNTVPTHLQSLIVDSLLITEPTLIIIDDIFTLGRTAMASAMKLQEAFPDKEIKVFCPFRTRSFEDKNILNSLEIGFMSLSYNGDGVRLPD